MTFDKSVVVPLDPDATFALVTQPGTASAMDGRRRPGGVTRRGRLPMDGDAGAHRGGHRSSTWTLASGWCTRAGWEEDADLPPGGSTVTVTLTPVDGGTEVRLVHDGLTDEQAAHHAVGWNHFLGRLVAAGRDGDAGPDEWAAAPDPLDELVLRRGDIGGSAARAAWAGFLRPDQADSRAANTPWRSWPTTVGLGMTSSAVAQGARMPERELDASLETQVADAAQAALEAWRRRGLGGYGRVGVDARYPQRMPVGILSLEFLVHAWDFAMATGRHVVVSEPVADYVLGLAGKVITPAARGSRDSRTRSTTAADAGVLDRLIAFTGRQPAVVQTSAN